MYVARISCPQLLDLPLETTQQTVDQERVGVGCDLRRDPPRQSYEGRRQRFAQAKDSLEARESYLDALPYSGSTLCPLGSQEDACFGQLLAQILAAVSEVCQEPPRYPVSQLLCIGQELFRELDIDDVGGGEFVGERNAVGRAQQMQLHPVDAESSPPHPRRTIEARSLRNLARVDDRKERRIDAQGFPGRLPVRRVTNALRAPRRVGVFLPSGETRKSTSRQRLTEKVREKAGGVSEEGSLALYPRSCWKSARVMTSESESFLRDS